MCHINRSNRPALQKRCGCMQRYSAGDYFRHSDGHSVILHFFRFICLWEKDIRSIFKDTHHKSIGNFSCDHSKRKDVQSRMVLVHVRLALLEDDEGRHHHQREGDHRRQDAGALRRWSVYLALWRREGEDIDHAILSLRGQFYFMTDLFV